MNVFLSKYTNLFYAYIVKYVYQITNKFLGGIFLLFFTWSFYIKLEFYAFENVGKQILEEFWSIIRH